MWILIANSLLLGVGLAMDAFSVSIANGLENPQMKKTKAVVIALVFAVFQAVMPLLGWVCVHFVAEKFAIFNKIVPYIALVLLSFIGGKMIFESIKEHKEKKNSLEQQNGTNSKSFVVKKENSEKNEVPEFSKEYGIETPNKEYNVEGLQFTRDYENPAEVHDISTSAEDKDLNEESGNDNKTKVKKLGFVALMIQGIATSIDALSVGFTISEYNYIQAIVSALIIALVTFVICIVGVIIGKKIGNKFTGKAEIVGGIILIAIGLEIFIKSFF